MEAVVSVPAEITCDRSDGLLRTSDLAKLLCVAPRTVCLWAEVGEVPAFKFRRQWRFRPMDVQRWLGRQNPKGSLGVEGFAARRP